MRGLRRNSNRAIAISLLLALVLAACGGESTDSTTTTAASGESTTTAGGDTTTTADEGPATPTTPDEILNYEGEDRQEFLQACAEEEGTVVLYTSSSASEEVVKPAFEAAFPGITLEVFRETNELPQILIEEELAGRHNFDVYEDAYGNLLIDDEFFAPFYTPRRGELYPELNQEYFVSSQGYLMSVAYNTDLVSAEEAPQTYEDLLDPKWEGQIYGGTDTTAPRTSHLIAREFGEEFLAEVAQAVQAQEGVSSSGLRDLLIAGQVPIGWNVSSSYLKRNTLDEGAPLMWVPMSPVNATFQVIGISKNAPHPCGAALYVDFSLSEEGQALYAELGNASPFEGEPLLPYLPPGYEDTSEWNLVFNTDPELIEGYDSYQDALAAWNEEFRNAFIRG